MSRERRGGHLQAGGVSPLSLLTFFAAAKKVSAAPHRGNADRPKAKQGKANAERGPNVGKESECRPAQGQRR
ncbi:hypothetical protein D0B32_00125 [Paraburkholderia sp. DHOC27]|nr:hypothetical protein D0B32_00125 [Paraburkholderia sp. DHOC27]